MIPDRGEVRETIVQRDARKMLALLDFVERHNLLRYEGNSDVVLAAE
jgi:hypothetical protein